MGSENQNNVEEIQKQWESFKNRAMIVLIGSMSTLVFIGMWVGVTNNRISNSEAMLQAQTARIQTIEKDHQLLEVSIAEVKTHLVNVLTNLEEIKQKIK